MKRIIHEIIGHLARDERARATAISTLWLLVLISLTPIFFGHSPLAAQLLFWRADLSLPEDPGLGAPMAIPVKSVFVVLTAFILTGAAILRLKRFAFASAVAAVSIFVTYENDVLSVAKVHTLLMLAGFLTLGTFAWYAKLRTWYVLVFVSLLAISAVHTKSNEASTASAFNVSAAVSGEMALEEIGTSEVADLQVAGSPGQTDSQQTETKLEQFAGSAIGLAAKVFSLRALYRTSAWSIFDLLQVIALLMFARFAALVVQQNMPFMRRLSKSNVLYIVQNAFVLWLPLLTVFVLATWLWSGLATRTERWMVEGIGAQLLSKHKPCAGLPESPSEISEEFAKDINLEKAINLAAKHYADRMNACFNSQADATAMATQLQTDSAVNEVSPAIKRGFPDRMPGTEQERCKIFWDMDVKCLLLNGIKSTANSGYVNARGYLFQTMDAKFQAFQREVAERKDGTTATVKDFADELKEDSVLGARAAVSKTFASMRILSVIFTMYSVLVLSKTFLLVAGRVAFRRSAAPVKEGKKAQIAQRLIAVLTVSRPKGMKQLFATLDGDGSTKTQAKIALPPNEARPFEYFLPSGMSFHVARSADVNTENHLSIPHMTYAPLRRLLHRSYSFNRISEELVSEGMLTKDPVRILLKQDEVIISWELSENEDIVIDWSRVLGFSSGIRFSKEYSFRLSSLVFGQIRIFKAKGPGIVLFRAEGSPVFLQPGTGRKATTMVAWRTDEEFTIESAKTWRDTFFSQHLMESTNGAFISDPGRSGSGPGTSIGRFVTQFLLPI